MGGVTRERGGGRKRKRESCASHHLEVDCLLVCLHPKALILGLHVQHLRPLEVDSWLAGGVLDEDANEASSNPDASTTNVLETGRGDIYSESIAAFRVNMHIYTIIQTDTTLTSCWRGSWPYSGSC